MQNNYVISVSSFAAGGLGSVVPCYVLASVSRIAIQRYVIRVMLYKAIIRISTFSSGKSFYFKMFNCLGGGDVN